MFFNRIGSYFEAGRFASSLMGAGGLCHRPSMLINLKRSPRYEDFYPRRRRQYRYR